MRRRPRGADELVMLGRRVAAANGFPYERSNAEWLAYGQACQDALAAGRPMPPLQPASAPPPPPRVTEPQSVGLRRQSPDNDTPDARATAHAADPRRSLSASIAWGLTWRYGVLAALFLIAQSQPHTPWLVMGAVLAGGMLLGLWRRRWALARLWRTVVIAGAAVWVAPLYSTYPFVLAGSLSALTLAPVISSVRRR